MTLFRKVFGQQEAGSPGLPDAQVGDTPQDATQAELVTMDELKNVFSKQPTFEPPQPETAPNVPSPEAVAEAQSYLRAAQVSAAPVAHTPEPVAPPAAAPIPPQAPPAPAIEMPVAAAQQPAAEPTAQPQRRSNKTRILGFNPSLDDALDPIRAVDTVEPETNKFPVGWVVVTDGLGIGSHFPIFAGVSYIGRGENQTIPLDFGDNSISRESHAALAFDTELAKFYLGHGGKSNIIRLNDMPVLSTEEVQSGDAIRIGETTLRLVALCDGEFEWGNEHNVG